MQLTLTSVLTFIYLFTLFRYNVRISLHHIPDLVIYVMTIAFLMYLPLLENIEKSQMAWGTKRTIETNQQMNCQPLGFATSERPLTVLASFPGSGNTRLRHLLQQASGTKRLNLEI